MGDSCVTVLNAIREFLELQGCNDDTIHAAIVKAQSLIEQHVLAVDTIVVPRMEEILASANKVVIVDGG